MLIIVLCTTTTPTAVATSAGSRRPPRCAFGLSMAMESPVGRGFGRTPRRAFYHPIVVIATDFDGDFAGRQGALRFPAELFDRRSVATTIGSAIPCIRFIDNQSHVAAHSVASKARLGLLPGLNYGAR